MAMSGAFRGSATSGALITFLMVLAVLVASVGGRQYQRYGSDCPRPFSCGGLRNVSYPFRRQGDPPGCGVPSYQLDCSDTKSTIQINTGRYYVTDINYTGSFFWVIDENLDMNSDCPVPHSDQLPYIYGLPGPNGTYDLVPGGKRATFLNCSQEVRNNSRYRPVVCLSTTSSFVYVLANPYDVGVEYLKASCSYLATTPLDDSFLQRIPLDDTSPEWAPTDNGQGEMVLGIASYADVVKSMRKGFAVNFPINSTNGIVLPKRTLLDRIYYCMDAQEWNLQQDFYWFRHGHGPTGMLRTFLLLDSALWNCIYDHYTYDDLPYGVVGRALWVVKWIAVICRFLLAPLAVLVFLAYMFWKTKMTVDAVEKFLQMQQTLGPTRYAYTDITAITKHFRDKLGHGGYGSVYKGVLLPGEVHVAVKMLGNSSCNGEDFISEVSTIGRIHHINMVRLVGFCSEMRRALVYEYMPNGSLDKYIFSSEKSFSWDKLNEIDLGIARGINYLHQGNFVPKVADFGLVKLYPRDNSFVPVSAARGTIGYIAPEMISRSFGVISSKSDIYSFGMLLLEMAGGRRNADPHAGNSSQAYYPAWMYSRLAGQVTTEISGTVEMHELEKKLCIIGLWCIQMKSQDRPTMAEVIEMLEAGVDDLEMAPRPFFCDDDQSPVMGSHYLTSELTAISEEEE